MTSATHLPQILASPTVLQATPLSAPALSPASLSSSRSTWPPASSSRIPTPSSPTSCPVRLSRRAASRGSSRYPSYTQLHRPPCWQHKDVVSVRGGMSTVGTAPRETWGKRAREHVCEGQDTAPSLFLLCQRASPVCANSSWCGAGIPPGTCSRESCGGGAGASCLPHFPFHSTWSRAWRSWTSPVLG